MRRHCVALQFSLIIAFAIVCFAVTAVDAEEPAVRRLAAGEVEGLKPELARLESAIAKLRDGPGFRARSRLDIVWWDPEVSSEQAVPKDPTPAHASERESKKAGRLTAKFDMLARGRLYRADYLQECQGLMDLAIAFDGKHWQELNGSRYEKADKPDVRFSYSGTEQNRRLGMLQPPPPLCPFQFLSVDHSRYVTWSDLFDKSAIHRRLADGVAGTCKTKDGQRPTVTFPAGKFDGRTMSLRVFVDGPDGRPLQTEYLDDRGLVRHQEAFRYVDIGHETVGPLADGLTGVGYDAKGRRCLTLSGSAEFEFGEKAADDAFTIDITDVNHVYDLDANKTVKGYDWEMKEEVLRAQSATQPEAKEK